MYGSGRFFSQIFHCETSSAFMSTEQKGFRIARMWVWSFMKLEYSCKMRLMHPPLRLLTGAAAAPLSHTRSASIAVSTGAKTVCGTAARTSRTGAFTLLLTSFRIDWKTLRSVMAGTAVLSTITSRRLTCSVASLSKSAIPCSSDSTSKQSPPEAIVRAWRMALAPATGMASKRIECCCRYCATVHGCSVLALSSPSVKTKMRFLRLLWSIWSGCASMKPSIISAALKIAS
mmetsp:Transcript_19152/g.33106  ORF Transcript_19152/g.33106 Transcript_19152/m.33106 type:complete len:231 (-) Transcript_19152:689-1381(-)